MCVECWEDLGSPKLDTPKVREAGALIARLYEEISFVGSPMHVQLDDWNIDGSFFSGDTLRDIYQPDYQTLDDEQRALVLETHAAMCALSEDERASALALESGYWQGEHAYPMDGLAARVLVQKDGAQ